MRGPLPQAILNHLQMTDEGEIPKASWGSFSAREWARALAWLDLSGLAIYFLHRIKGLDGFDAVPASVRRGLERRAADNRIRTQGIIRELERLSLSFKKAGVEYAILKGTALLPDYCPDPALRTQYDHDVLVDRVSLEAADLALEREGYERKATTQWAAVYRSRQPRVRFPDNSDGLYSPLLGRSIEMHLALWEDTEEKIPVNLPDDFLERSRWRRWDDFEYMALCDEDCLLFQVLHAFKHILRNWCRLSVLLEIAYFLNGRSSDSAFWNRFRDRMTEVQWVREASFVVFNLAERLFGASVPDHFRASLATSSSPALNLWIERYGLHSAFTNFCEDKSSLFLHEEFVEDRSEWAQVRRRRLLPFQFPHRPPAVVFQRGYSSAGRLWMESVHAIRRLKFHGLAGLRYALEYPRWVLLRRMRLSAQSEGL